MMSTQPVGDLVFFPGCRVCLAQTSTVLDLGLVPVANHLTVDGTGPEHPLVLEFCDGCGTLQLRDTPDEPDLFDRYLYETPDVPVLRDHYDRLKAYMVTECDLTADGLVVEAGSNTGAFLASLTDTTERVIGVDPAKRIAENALVPTVADYFTPTVAQGIREDHGPAQIIVARHCMAHNQHPAQMLMAARHLAALDGTLIIENAYALDMLEQGDFSQVYAEHMFYWTASAMRHLLDAHGWQLVDCWPSPVQNGSMVYVAKHHGRPTSRLLETLTRERIILNAGTLTRFREHALSVADELSEFVRRLRRAGQTVAAYGATAKATTLLAAAGLTSEEVAFCVDSTPVKQGLRLPGSRIPIVSEQDASVPDYFVLTAHNFREEIVRKVRATGNTHTRFIVAFPFVRLLDE